MSGPLDFEPVPTRLRPFSSPENGSDRTAQFGLGMTGDDPGNSPTSAGQDAGLNLNGQQFAAQVPHGVRPTSVLQSLRPSMNGMSAQDYERVLPGGYTLPTQNGQSASSWETSNYLRMQGQDSV